MPLLRRATPLLVLPLLLGQPGAATAEASGTGGAAAELPPTISSWTCVPAGAASCPAPTVPAPGAQLVVRGADLLRVRTVVFRGARGPSDDVRARVRHSGRTHVDVPVPHGVRRGPIELRAAGGARAVSRRKLEVASPPIAPSTADGVFPIRGPHDLGQTATNDFGGERRHQGQDLFARCGTPLVVPEAGTVKEAATEARAGNFAVVTATASGRDYVFMHMRSPAGVSEGQAVSAGQPLGQVGDSGNASGCHLHFEIWSAPGWYSGGTAMDPLPDLRTWDAQDAPHGH